MSALELLAFAAADADDFGEDRRPIAQAPADKATEYEIALSIAISLKRIADVAETTAMGLWNYDPTRDPFGNPKGGEA